jgi:hypothetical protein
MCGGIASVTGNLVQSKLGVATGVMAMWLLNQLTSVNAESVGFMCAALCVTYFKGLSKGSRTDCSPTILPSNTGVVDAMDVCPPILGVDAPGSGGAAASTD